MNGHYPSCPAYGHPTYSACHCTSIQTSLDDLRAKVEALPQIVYGHRGQETLLYRADVLDLIGGGSDE